MSLEELKTDFAANSEAIKKLDAMTSTHDLVNLLKFTIWPFQENLVREMEEMDQQIQDFADGIDDILHEETAGIIAAPIIAARAIIARFKAALPATATDELLAIKKWERMAKSAEETIQEIVVMNADDEDEEEPEDAEDDDDSDDADDDKESE